MPGDLIEYDVFDSLDNIIHEGVFSVSNDATIYFNQPGEYSVVAFLEKRLYLIH